MLVTHVQTVCGLDPVDLRFTKQAIDRPSRCCMHCSVWVCLPGYEILNRGGFPSVPF